MWRLRRVDAWRKLAEEYRRLNRRTDGLPEVDDQRYRLLAEFPATIPDDIGWWRRARRWNELVRLASKILDDPKSNDVVRGVALVSKIEALQQLDRPAELEATKRDAVALANRFLSDSSETALRWTIYLLGLGGQPDRAANLARQYVSDSSLGGDAFQRWGREEFAARRLAQMGRASECLPLLQKLLAEPSGLTIPVLRSNLDFDGIHDNAEFKALLADPKNSAPL